MRTLLCEIMCIDCVISYCTAVMTVGVDIDFQLFNKTSTRLPEALLYVFRPQHSRSWQMSKLGHLVDPLNVVLNGSQYQHGMYYNLT